MDEATNPNPHELSEELRKLPPAVLTELVAALDRNVAENIKTRERMHDLHTLLVKIARQSSHRSAAAIIQLASNGLNEIYEKRGPL